MKVYRPLFFVISLILIIGMACSFGSPAVPTVAPTVEVVQPTDEPIPTDIPMLTDEPIPTEEALPTEEPTTEAPTDKFFTEEFNQPLSESAWSHLIEGENKDKATFEAVDGAYKIDLQGANTKIKVEYLAASYSDVRIDVSTDNRGKNTGAVLLICRASSEGWYQTQIANDGRFWIQAYDKVGLIKKGINLIANGASTHIKSGRARNDYTFICSGNTITLGVNGVEERRIKETKYNYISGHIGFGLESVYSLPIITLFNSFKVSLP